MSIKTNISNETKIAAIIPAAGIGKRLGVGYNKQYIDLLGVPMVVRTMQEISTHPQVTEVIFVVGQQEIEYGQELVDKYNLHKVTAVVGGGKERVYSVINGFKNIQQQDIDYLLMHDGARPLITQAEIESCIQKATEIGAAIVAVPVKDTIKIINSDNKLIQQTPSRNTLWAAQTPQIIKRTLFAEAIAEIKDLDTITDDSMLIELLGKPVAVVKGSYENIKVTTPEDVTFAEMILTRRTQK
ncbi:2-C-methyl-D-erythritol 4-phosphate cytidylyltransferase [Desulfuribacillus alkaliarsenatis]|uniref:2-C-methyl-D-erythritol 4-phosphate cytidylyltransferase n=1 Tax=Desulfuribacillus alkaliarsenatis TaxID=766136 RepID=A0A1E5G4E4_9FIRM|nr:2-C-methyl-D-erythritol 4-phosphate cytidylyltransferase [Desulfuribacillus alkaliarsenatis]OEF97963.1 2-C-methyl-D-erythritol 4-phosphate cytidylyltransferase [Desulfuribacillus alkaliarsenatis]